MFRMVKSNEKKWEIIYFFPFYSISDFKHKFKDALGRCEER